MHFGYFVLHAFNIGVIIDRLLPDQYTKTMVGSVVDQQVFSQLIKVHVPSIHAHLQTMYLDTSVFSVPWFLCLYLNTVKSQLAPLLLDFFFLEGPRFLFIMAIAVIKINEPLLINAKDDDIFMSILKKFFTRLSLEENDKSDEICGIALYDLLIQTCFSLPINNGLIESLRNENRLRIVQQMEETNRKAQIRTLSENSTLKFEEIAVVYDQMRALEFFHANEDDDPIGEQAERIATLKLRELELRELCMKAGGWGLVTVLSSSKPSSTAPKSISMVDFQQILYNVSTFNHPSRIASNTADRLYMNIAERMYIYCSFQYNSVQHRKNSDTKDMFIVDLAALCFTLDTFMKQPLHTRLRFMFDLHDLDGDGLLDELELKAFMDSLLDIFQSSSGAGKEEEQYLKAVSSFMGASLQMGAKNQNNFKLSYNEFLLSILSQSVFVEYFERKAEVGPN